MIALLLSFGFVVFVCFVLLCGKKEGVYVSVIECMFVCVDVCVEYVCV